MLQLWRRPNGVRRRFAAANSRPAKNPPNHFREVLRRAKHILRISLFYKGKMLAAILMGRPASAYPRMPMRKAIEVFNMVTSRRFQVSRQSQAARVLPERWDRPGNKVHQDFRVPRKEESIGQPRGNANAKGQAPRRSALTFVAIAAVLIVALGAAAGCKRATPIPPDTAPIFSATVADQSYTVGEAIAALTLPAASGGNGELRYTLEPAVPGLSFDAAARILSGTPSGAGSYAMEYKVEDGDENTEASDADTLTFAVTVEEPAPPDTAPNFSATVGDQSYTVGEAIAALTLPAASGGNGELRYTLEPAVPGLSFDAATRTLSGTPTSAGSYAMEYKVEDGDENTEASDADTLTFAVTVEEPAPPDTAPNFSATVGDQSYTVGEAIAALTLPAASGGNGELRYTLEPAVPGLSFDVATRTLSGTPTSAGSYAMEYKVEDGDENTEASDADTLTFAVTVEEPAPPDTAPNFSATVGDQSYTVGEAIAALTLPAASGGNGELRYTLEPAVPGLSFDAATRTLSGTPTSAGSYAMEYKVEDGDENTEASDADTLTFAVTVEEPAPPDTAPNFSATVGDQSYTVGEAIAALTLPAASGGNGELRYTLEPAVPGLSFDAATRTLSGTPTSAGSYAMEYKVEDGDENTEASDADTLTFAVTVEEPAPPDTAPNFSATVADQSYTVGEAIAALTLPAASGGNGELRYTLEPAVPGLSFDAAARILSGTPSGAGSYAMEYKVEDGDENTEASDADTLTFAVTVEEPAPPDTWRTVVHVEGGFFRDVAWSESLSRFVAIGWRQVHPFGPIIMYSPDGENWSTASIGFAAGPSAVTWSESLARFVAVGSTSMGVSIVHSKDGRTWSEATSSGMWSGFLMDVSSSESLSRFVAVGEGGLIIHSADGDTWSEAETSGASRTLSSVAWSEGLARFVAVGFSTTIIHSSDGDRWSFAASSPPGSLSGVTSSESLIRFVAVGSRWPTSIIMHSNDGNTWTEASPVWNQIFFEDVVWSESLRSFVAVGTDGAIVHSRDGDSWSEVASTGTSHDLTSVAWSESLARFVAVGASRSFDSGVIVASQ